MVLQRDRDFCSRRRVYVFWDQEWLTIKALTPSTRVKFLLDETSMKVVNLNIDQRLIEKEDVNFKNSFDYSNRPQIL